MGVMACQHLLEEVSHDIFLLLSPSAFSCAAKGVEGKIHQRMPGVLLWENEKEMEASPVAPAVNRPSIDSAELIKPLRGEGEHGH